MLRPGSAALVLILLALAGAGLLAKTPGIFRGTIIRVSDGDSQWVYIRCGKDLVRRVSFAKARIVYDDSVPQQDREASPSRALREGVELRVTAEQDDHGEWHATMVEILSLGENGKKIADGDRPRMPNDECPISIGIRQLAFGVSSQS